MSKESFHRIIGWEDAGCEVCRGAAYVKVEAVRYDDAETWMRPTSYRETARFCPRCGRELWHEREESR